MTTRGTRRRGFTLIELIVAMSMLTMVLVAAYKILDNCMRTERDVERAGQPDKVAEAIVSLLRRDLAGCFYRGLTERLDRQVFRGENNSSGDGESDRVTFLTTSEPTRLQTNPVYEQEIENLRSVTLVSYFVEQNPRTKYPSFRLYRKEVTDLMAGRGDAPGLNLDIYDKVKSFNVEYYDGTTWDVIWDSEQRLRESEEYFASLSAPDMLQQRIARVSDQEDADAAAAEEEVLPPAAIPVAVRIEIQVYGGLGDEIFVENEMPVVRKLRTIVPLFAAQRIPIVIEEDPALAGAEGEDGEDGAAAGIRGRPSDFGLGASTTGRGGARGGRGGGPGAGGRGGGGFGGRGGAPGAGAAGGRGGGFGGRGGGGGAGGRGAGAGFGGGGSGGGAGGGGRR